MSDVTRILSKIAAGAPQASADLLPLVYDELRKLAAAKMAQEQSGQTLQATALVHEAYVRLVDTSKGQDWNGRAHFFAAAAEAMRRILVESARRKSGPKAGGDYVRVDLSQISPESVEPGVDLIEMSEAIDRLAAMYPRAAEVVKLRFFAGLTNQQTATTLNVALSTVKLDWKYAKNWLRAELMG